MEFSNQLYERCSFIRTVCAFQESLAYPVCLALLCAISGLFGKQVYVPLISVMSVLVIFSALFAKDLKVLFAPFFMAFYSLGSDNTEDSGALRDELIEVFDTSALVTVCLLGVLMFAVICVRLAKEGIFSDIATHRGPFLYSILALNAALLLNGLFCPKWRPMDMVFGLLFALGLTVCYYIFGALLRRSGASASYVSFCMVCTACVVLLQILVLVWRLYEADELFRDLKGTLIPQLRRENIQLAWGYATNISGVIILGIPAAFYLARSHRFSLVYYILALLFIGGALMTGTRSTSFIGSAVFVICALLCCFSGKNKNRMRLYIAATLLLFAALLLCVHRFVLPLSDDLLSEFLAFFRIRQEDLVNDSRLALWKNGLEDFVSSPIFGTGFGDGGYLEKGQYSNVFNDMYHNIFIQFVGAMGIVGIIALLWHMKDLCQILFRQWSVKKALVLVLPITLLLTSLLDNFFFYFNFQIFYAAYLALIEQSFTQPIPVAAKKQKNV